MSASRTTVVNHVVLLKVHPSTDDETVERLKESLRSLIAIPGVISITVGETFAEPWMRDRRDGFTHCLSVLLESKDALRVYQDHPLHVETKAKQLLPVLGAPPVAVDYETTVTNRPSAPSLGV